MFVYCMFLELDLNLIGVVLNLTCFWTLPERSVLVRCSGFPVVDLLHGSLVTVVWLYLLKGLNPSAQHVGFGRVSITGCPALSKDHPEF